MQCKDTEPGDSFPIPVSIYLDAHAHTISLIIEHKTRPIERFKRHQNFV